jgi:hypothetical protein
MSKHYQVEQIINYLKEKIANLKSKLAEYEGPIMADLAKNSVHLQFDYIRLKTELQCSEDHLLMIDKFTELPDTKRVKDESKKDRQGRKG